MVPESTVAEVHLLDLVAVSIVVLMVTGLETAQLETGRTNVIAVGKRDILREIARTVPRSSGVVKVTPGHL